MFTGVFLPHCDEPTRGLAGWTFPQDDEEFSVVELEGFDSVGC